MECLLELWDVIEVVGNEEFSATDTFFNNANESGVQISHRGRSFIEWFCMKNELDIPDSEIIALTLNREVYDESIITALKGEEATKLSLSEIWRILERQSKCQSGLLLTNGLVNIFYVKDASGILRVITISKDKDGWVIHAFLTGKQCGWYPSVRIFTRNS